MINTLRQEILSELQNIDSISEVFDWIPQKLKSFPSVFFNFDRVESSNLDSNHNERIYFFQINILQETKILWNNNAEKNICDIIDEIIDTFDRSDLNWNALYIDAVGWNIDSVETESWPSFHAIIVLWIHTPFTIYQ